MRNSQAGTGGDQYVFVVEDETFFQHDMIRFLRKDGYLPDVEAIRQSAKWYRECVTGNDPDMREKIQKGADPDFLNKLQAEITACGDSTEAQFKLCERILKRPHLGAACGVTLSKAVNDVKYNVLLSMGCAPPILFMKCSKDSSANIVAAYLDWDVNPIPQEQQLPEAWGYVKASEGLTGEVGLSVLQINPNAALYSISWAISYGAAKVQLSAILSRLGEQFKGVTEELVRSRFFTKSKDADVVRQSIRSVFGLG